MKLPENSIGISDILAYRDCPRRFSYGMKRHTGQGSQSDTRTPEAYVYYGSALHLVLEELEDGTSVEDAITKAVKAYPTVLDPTGLKILREDLEKYRERDFPNTRTLASEDEFRVPLFITPDGTQIYFRFKLDRLYERTDSPGTFIHVDYKTSRWPKSEKEVHEDLQMWAYNWAIHEYWPDCNELIQVYDQLRAGQITTVKSDEQRGEIRQFLIEHAKAILADEDFQDDGLLAARFNQWCPWCPILESCPVVAELSDWSLIRIASLATQRAKLKKDGTPSKRLETVPLDEGRLQEYIEEMERVKRARQVLERFETAVRQLVVDLPDARRQEAGYEIRERSNTVFSPTAAQALHEALGERFYTVAKLTKTGIENGLADQPDVRDWALGLAEREVGSATVVRRKQPT